MNSFPHDEVLDQLRWRYAVKTFDTSRKIPADAWAKLEEALILAPSSYGLQPWKFFVVEDPGTREKLLPHTWGQRQIVDASHLVVFAVKADVGPTDVERLIARSAEVRGIHPDVLVGYKKLMIGSMAKLSPELIREWMTRQVFIAHGVFLTTAAMMGIDACPMEGFVAAQYDEILGLPAKGYRSVVLATAGYRAVDDANATLAKVRFRKSEIIETI